jgi:hypothetical protein
VEEPPRPLGINQISRCHRGDDGSIARSLINLSLFAIKRGTLVGKQAPARLLLSWPLPPLAAALS